MDDLAIAATLPRTQAGPPTAEPTGLCRGFVAIRGYRNAHGEVADYLLNGGVSYLAAVRRSLEETAGLAAEAVAAECPACAGDVAIAQRALDEQRASWKKTLAGESTAPDVFTHVEPGLKAHNESGSLYVWGLLVRKTVREPGVRPVVASRPLTLVKAWIVALAPVGRYRQFGPLDIQSGRADAKWEVVVASGLVVTPDGHTERREA